MTALKPPTFMKMANDYLESKSVTLEAVTARFQKLEGEDKRLYFGQLCQRKQHVSMHLIDLLFALNTAHPSRRQVAVRLLQSLWHLKRGEKGLDESMLTAITEQYAP